MPARREIFLTCPDRHCLNELRLVVELLPSQHNRLGQQFVLVGGERRCQTWHNHPPELRNRDADLYDFTAQEVVQAWEQAGLVKNQSAPGYPG